MVTREERIEQLYMLPKKGAFNLSWAAAAGLGLGWWIYTNASLPMLAMFVFLMMTAVPLSRVAWQKTRVSVTFNENRSYQRLIRAKGVIAIAMLWVMLGLMGGYVSGYFALPVFSGLSAILIAGMLVVETWLDTRLLRIDHEHVTDSLIGFTKRERMKRKWEKE
ncbi:MULTISPECIES: hypothetical protein [unclassified Exiguobacterium]|uniref:hypothetical protein n=1 Tax=unclassified Exiguobacterium TaxID=2644629 RepID=UPI0010394C36|nr:MULTISPECIES: hypothetical protein [unclassified Exiguobacterium]TCI67479.1 hypothetical protein EVJ19_13025 [Exiguobacterium sp. IPCI3]TCI76817.1 hypothetical protein EVJ18_13015 [Exiguobacterium sp. IPCH1]TCI78562.1 hypothetical protein EVJ17_13015 [Exiguobacterium sp. IPBC4]